MKTKIISLFLPVIFILSCDDAGIVPTAYKVEVTVNGLKPLSQNQGVYEAWISVGTLYDHGDDAYKSIGRFNITEDGRIIPPDAFNLNKISDISSAEDAIITIEPPFDRPDTIDGVKLIGGAKYISGSSFSFNLTMDYIDIMGNVATQIKNSECQYMLLSLSTNDTSRYRQGFWFTKDVNGTTQGLTVPVISDTLQWYYRAWVVDIRDSLNSLLYAGGFDNPMNEDDYRFCYTSSPINIPGNDWVETGGQCPNDLIDLSSGFYRLIVTLEPRTWNWVNSKPFYIQIFRGIIPSSSYGTILSLTNTASSTMPSAVIRFNPQ